MVRGCLCPHHREQADAAAPEELVATISQCCSQGPDYLEPRLPLLEAIFRLLLARGNRPLEAEDIAQELSRSRGLPLYPETVERLLQAEPRFYGVCRIDTEVEGEEGGEAA